MLDQPRAIQAARTREAADACGRSDGCQPPSGPTREAPFAGLLEDYLAFLRQHRGLSAATLYFHRRWGQRFLRHLAERLPGCDLGGLSAQVVDDLGTVVFLAAVLRLGTIGETTGPAGIFTYGVLIGLGYSMPTSLTPLLTADFFRGAHYGSIFGTVNFVYQLGGALGVWLAGYLHDATGSYRVPLVLAAAAALAAAGVIVEGLLRRGEPRRTEVR